MNEEGLAGTKSAEEIVLENPEFRLLLRRRSQLRWSLSGVLVAAYIGWAMAGLYAQDALGAKFMESSLTWGIVTGYIIIAFSIVCSIIYLQVINRLYVSLTLANQEDH